MADGTNALAAGPALRALGVLIAATVVIGGVSAASAQTINKCQASTKGCVSKSMKAMLGCHAKAEGKDIAANTTCLAKAQNKFSNADGKGCTDKLEAAVRQEKPA